MFLAAKAPRGQNVSEHKMCSKDFKLYNIQNRRHNIESTQQNNSK